MMVEHEIMQQSLERPANFISVKTFAITFSLKHSTVIRIHNDTFATKYNAKHALRTKAGKQGKQEQQL